MILCDDPPRRAALPPRRQRPSRIGWPVTIQFCSVLAVTDFVVSLRRTDN